MLLLVYAKPCFQYFSAQTELISEFTYYDMLERWLQFQKSDQNVNRTYFEFRVYAALLELKCHQSKVHFAWVRCLVSPTNVLKVFLESVTPASAICGRVLIFAAFNDIQDIHDTENGLPSRDSELTGDICVTSGSHVNKVPSHSNMAVIQKENS